MLSKKVAVSITRVSTSNVFVSSVLPSSALANAIVRLVPSTKTFGKLLVDGCVINYTVCAYGTPTRKAGWATLLGLHCSDNDFLCATTFCIPTPSMLLNVEL